MGISKKIGTILSKGNRLIFPLTGPELSFAPLITYFLFLSALNPLMRKTLM